MEKATTGQHSVCRTRHVARYEARRFTTGWCLLVAPLLLVVCAVLAPAFAVAEEQNEIKAADTSSPRATLKSFIDACNEIHQVIQTDKYLCRTAPEHAELAARALDCIDMSELPAFAREEHAAEAGVCLKEVLDRVKLKPWDEIPGAEDIEKAGGFEKLSRWRIPGTRITIARVEEGAQRHEYLFSPGTVERAVTYYQNVQHKKYRKEGNGPQVSRGFYHWHLSAPGHPALATIVSRLPEGMQRGRTWGLANW